jgi:pyrimidine-nucleoside phosphorylase
MATRGIILEILSSKRQSLHHTREEIGQLTNGFVSGEVTDYQMSAWLMAVCINGLDDGEVAALTDAMVASGETIDLSSLPGVSVDKHSTGGVGDKTTLVLAPLLASAGLTVAKMSGRGLGITGGTIDKLESIPGFRTDLTREQFLRQAGSVGCVISGQTANLVPADKKIYALRDVTATVDCIPLIASSVMSKKIASGASAILLDVKVGSGAFVGDIEGARKLAMTMIDIGNRVGRRTAAAITSMDQPLGLAVGNCVEVAEAIETLRGRGPDDLRALCIELGSMLHCMAIHSKLSDSRSRLTELLDSGAALSKFAEMVEAQGGDPGVVDDPSILPEARFSHSVTSITDGYIQAADAGSIGRAAGLLGAGRQKKDDIVDPAAGVILRRKIGDRVSAGDELALLVHSREIEHGAAIELVRSALLIGPKPAEPGPLVIETLGF